MKDCIFGFIIKHEQKNWCCHSDIITAYRFLVALFMYYISLKCHRISVVVTKTSICVDSRCKRISSRLFTVLIWHVVYLVSGKYTPHATHAIHLFKGWVFNSIFTSYQNSIYSFHWNNDLFSVSRTKFGNFLNWIIEGKSKQLQTIELRANHMVPDVQDDAM